VNLKTDVQYPIAAMYNVIAKDIHKKYYFMKLLTLSQERREAEVTVTYAG